MKYALVFVLLVIPVIVFSQASATANVNPRSRLVSPDSYNRVYPKALSAAAYDTLAKTTCGYLVGVSIDQPIANDTVVVSQLTASSGAVLLWARVPATAANPFYLPVGQVIDSTYVQLYSVKGGRFRLIYRTSGY